MRYLVKSLYFLRDDQNKEVRVRIANKTQEEEDDDDETRSEKLHKETMKKYTRGVELPNKRDIEVKEFSVHTMISIKSKSLHPVSKSNPNVENERQEIETNF